MLDCSADNLRDEIEAALHVRRQHTDLSEELIKRYAGDYYRADWQSQDFGHENHEFEFAANLIPQLVHTNPGIEVDSDIADPDDPQVLAIRYGMTQWVKKQHLAQKLTRIALDVCMDFGVALLTYTPTPGYDNAPESNAPAIWPVLHRISPRRFFTDPRAEDFDSKRFVGHIWIRDRDDLLNAVDARGAAKFDVEAVEGISSGGEDKRDRLSKIDEWLKVDRDQIVGFEIYVPETGMVYTLGYCSSGGRDGAYGFLRQPRKLEYCPASGPYVLFGCHVVPDQVYPLSPLAVTSGLVRELNAHSEQVSQDAAVAKNLVFVNSSNKALAEALNSSPSGSIIPITGGWKGELERVEIGGPQAANLEYTAILRERLDRRSGTSEQKRGVTTGATATEISEIAQADDARTAFARQQFHDCTVDMLNIAGRMMHECPMVRFKVATEDPVTGERIAGDYQGGPPVDPMTGAPLLDPRTGAPMQQISWDSMGVTITPYSMERVSQAVLQRRMAAIADLTPKILAMGVQMPWVNIRPLINDLYESMNIKNAGSRYVNFGMYEAFRQMAAMQMLTGGVAPGQPGEGPGPGGAQGAAKQRGQEAGAANAA